MQRQEAPARHSAPVRRPRIVATAHTASLTSEYFAAASRRLGDALAAYLDHQPPAGLFSTPHRIICPV
jgi:phosphoglycerate dehydrogenase-like enzyme